MNDTSLGCTSTVIYEETTSLEHYKELSEQTVTSNLQELGQQWERLLFATGGALCVEKSFWYLFSWTWNKSGNAKLKTIAQSPATLQLTSGSAVNQPIIVPRIEVADSFRTLGARLSPDGNTDKTVLHLHNQTMQHAACISSFSLNREASYWAFWQYLRPKVCFSIPTLSLTQAHCTHIQVPALQATLPKLHLNRNIARAVVFGPSSYAGLALPDLCTSEGISQLRLLLGHLRLRDKTAKLILIDMSYLQLLVGSSTLFLNLPHREDKNLLFV